VLPIAPSTSFFRKAQVDDPTRRSTRAQRDDAWRRLIQQACNFKAFSYFFVPALWLQRILLPELRELRDPTGDRNFASHEAARRQPVLTRRVRSWQVSTCHGSRPTSRLSRTFEVSRGSAG
jgi:hypothetical protein